MVTKSTFAYMLGCGLALATVATAVTILTRPESYHSKLSAMCSTIEDDAAHELIAYKLLRFLDRIKRDVVTDPQKKNYDTKKFSWKRDVFDVTQSIFSKIVGNGVTGDVLNKLLTNVDVIADEFENEHDAAYNAECATVASAWRKAMYAVLGIVEDDGSAMPMTNSLMAHNLMTHNKNLAAGPRKVRMMRQAAQQKMPATGLHDVLVSASQRPEMLSQLQAAEVDATAVTDVASGSTQASQTNGLSGEENITDDVLHELMDLEQENEALRSNMASANTMDDAQMRMNKSNKLATTEKPEGAEKKEQPLRGGAVVQKVQNTANSTAMDTPVTQAYNIVESTKNLTEAAAEDKRIAQAMNDELAPVSAAASKKATVDIIGHMLIAQDAMRP